MGAICAYNMYTYARVANVVDVVNHAMLYQGRRLHASVCERAMCG